MNALSSLAIASRGPVTTGTCPTALHRVRRPGVGLAIWTRAMPPDLSAAVSSIDLDTVDDLRVVSPAAGIGATLDQVMRDAGYDAAGDHAALFRDVAGLAALHARIERRGALRVRLEVVETDACRKFHADHVPLRTLCTYRGRGTEWTADGAPSHGMATGHVGLFKGRLWDEEPRILHRSPPMRTADAPRLLLAIDGADAS